MPAKQFWANVKSLGLGKNKKSNRICHSPESLIQHFTNNFSVVSDDSSAEAIFDSNNDGFFFRQIDIIEMQTAILSINNGSSGYDGIDIRFIKLILPLVADILLSFFNKLLMNSVFPRQWKRSIIVPIPKVKLPTSPSDYRPISLLPALSKVFERIMCDQMMEFLKRESLLCDHQSGYRAAHSTSTALLQIVEDIRVSVDLRKSTFLCLLDFSKAFDRVIHSRIYEKLLHRYKFSHSAAKLILDYLKNRIQFVRTDQGNSDDVDVLSGVPQGAIMGPIIFCLYIADIEEVISQSSFHLYADDVQLYQSCASDTNSIVKCIGGLNSDLRNIVAWAAENGLILNESKTQAMAFGIREGDLVNYPRLMVGNVAIPFSPKVRNLGIYLTNDLKWDAHIDSVCIKIFNIIRTLWKITYFASTELRRRLFLSFVFPHFVYADVVFYGMSEGNMSKLTRCFNACIRYVFRLRKFDHLSTYRNRLIGCNLPMYFNFRACWFFKQLLSSGTPSYLFDKLKLSVNHGNNLRIIVRSNRLKCSNSSLFVRGAMVWNGLPVELKKIKSRSLFFDKFVTYNNGSEYV